MGTFRYKNEYYKVCPPDVDSFSLDVILLEKFMQRTFVYATIKYSVVTSVKYGVHTFSQTYWKHYPTALRYLLQDYVFRGQIYFRIFSSRVVVYTLLVLLQENNVIQSIYGSDIGTLLWDFLIEISRLMYNEIPGLHTRILRPDSLDSDLSFTVIQTHSLDLLGPEFCNRNPQFVGDQHPIQMSQLINSVYGDGILSDVWPETTFHNMGGLSNNLEGFTTNEIEKFVGEVFDDVASDFVETSSNLPINYPKLNRKKCILIYMLGMSLYRMHKFNCEALSSTIVPINNELPEILEFTDPGLF